jgi:predicted RNA-binding Zn-ribbon protein involved in translation (DUF1610 family)
MPLVIECPMCGETDDLRGERVDEHIDITCGSCGQSWERSTSPVCPTCAGTDLQPVPLAIVEKSRGTQLSVVGIRIVHLCMTCDVEDIDRWQKYRPNPLLPKELPTVGETDD